MDAIACPECGLPAHIIERFALNSTDGLVDHVKMVCAAGHVRTPRVDRVASVADLLSEILHDHEPCVRHDTAPRGNRRDPGDR